MPNHVINKITAPAEVIAALGDPVDFERIIPTPEGFDWPDDRFGVGFGTMLAQELSDTMAGDPQSARFLNMTMSRPNPVGQWRDEDFEDFMRGMRSIRACGFADPLTLARRTWGTKWNAYRSALVSPDCVQFETAWSAPEPILRALSLAHPEAEIIHEWADEDIGSNCGRAIWSGGEQVCIRTESDMIASHVYALTLWGREDEIEGWGTDEDQDAPA